MITHTELARLHGVGTNTIRMRLRRAGLKPTIIKTIDHYPAKAAIAASAHRPVTIPAGYTTIAELQEITGRTKGCIHYRLRKAGITPAQTIKRRGTSMGQAGGHPMHLYPQREALLAALDNE